MKYNTYFTSNTKKITCVLVGVGDLMTKLVSQSTNCSVLDSTKVKFHWEAQKDYRISREEVLSLCRVRKH